MLISGDYGRCSISFNLQTTKSHDLGNIIDNLIYTHTNFLTYGTGNGNIDLLYRNTINLSIGGTVLDLYNGSLLSVFGQSLAFRKIDLIALINREPEVGVPYLESASSSPWEGLVEAIGVGSTYKILIPGVFLCVNNNGGWTVASGSKNIKLNTDIDDINIGIIIAGRSV